MRPAARGLKSAATSAPEWTCCRVAAPLQEPLSGAVNDLVGRVECVPPPPPPHEEHGHGKHNGHDKKHEEGD